MSSSETYKRNINTIFSGSVWIVMGMFTGYALEYGNKIFIARWMGLTSFGSLSLGFSIVMLLVSVSMMGINSGIARYIPILMSQQKHSDVKKMIKWGVIIILPLSIAVAVIMIQSRDFISDYIYKGRVESKILIPFAVLIPLAVLSEFFYSCLRGLKKPRQAILAREFCRRFGFFLFLVVFAFIGGKGLYNIAFGYLAGFFCYLVFSLYCVFKSIPGSEEIPESSLREFLFFSIPLMFSFLLTRFGSQMAGILIGLCRDPDEVGLFASALPFGRLINLPLTAVLFMFLPVMSESWHIGNPLQLVVIFHKICSGLFVIGSMLSIVLLMYSRQIMNISFGPEFVAAHKPLQVMTLGFLYATICGPTGAMLLAAGRSKEYFLGDIISVAVAFSCYVYFVPDHGYQAAAWIFAGQMVLRNTIRMISIYRLMRTLPFNLKMIIALLMMTGLYYGLDSLKPHLSLYIHVPLLVISSAGIMLAARIISLKTVLNKLPSKETEPDNE